MKEILEASFSRRYGQLIKEHSVNQKVLEGCCSLVDRNACEQCQSYFKDNCGAETFIINTNSPVCLLFIEDFINGIADLKTEKCDYLIYDNNSIVLVDLYCGMSNYLGTHTVDGKSKIGKIEKARNQIESTITLFLVGDELESKIAGMAKKLGVFAYRAKDKEMFVNAPIEVMKSEKAFLGLYNNIRSRKLVFPLSNGFHFLTHPYPKCFNWEEM